MVDHKPESYYDGLRHFSTPGDCLNRQFFYTFCALDRQAYEPLRRDNGAVSPECPATGIEFTWGKFAGKRIAWFMHRYSRQ